MHVYLVNIFLLKGVDRHFIFTQVDNMKWWYKDP